jgi:hypothetical protein
LPKANNWHDKAKWRFGSNIQYTRLVLDPYFVSIKFIIIETGIINMRPYLSAPLSCHACPSMCGFPSLVCALFVPCAPSLCRACPPLIRVCPCPTMPALLLGVYTSLPLVQALPFAVHAPLSAMRTFLGCVHALFVAVQAILIALCGMSRLVTTGHIRVRGPSCLHFLNCGFVS